MTEIPFERTKLKLWVMSDLHVDNAPLELPSTPEGTDVIIIAGDVADGHVKSAGWLSKHVVSRGKPVIFVPGNHEWHGHDLQEDPSSIYADAGVNLLHWRRPAILVGDTRFVGSTLWTDYGISGDPDAALDWAKNHMPDMRDIDFGFDRARAYHFSRRHYRDWSAMASGRDLGEASAIVFVTHHAPHRNSLCLEGPLRPSDASFASDLTEEIEVFAPDLWVHGHIHRSSDYVHHQTRIVCNPLGSKYKHKGPTPGRNQEYNPVKIVEI